LDFWQKVNRKYPDFKHKKTQEALWLIDQQNPPWVEAEVAAMAPGTVQLNIFSWNRRLFRHVKAGQYEQTMELFHQLQQEGLSPDRYTFVPVLNACASLQALAEGRCIHKQIIQSGFESDLFVGNSLIDMYAKCGSMEDTWRVFNKMPSCDVVSWNAMISGHVKCGQGQKALRLFQQMVQEGMEPDRITFVGVLNACASVVALEEGRFVHEQIIQRGLEFDVFVSNSLVDMYAKCGSMEDAWQVFNKMPLHDVVTWNALIFGHVKCGQGYKALELFQQMQQEGVQPNTITFVGFLNACASEAALEEGRCTHQQIISSSFESDLFVVNSLIDMYVKCGSMEEAWTVFNKMPCCDVVSWNIMISGHVKCGQGHKALALFRQMQLEGMKPNSATFAGVVNACASIVALEEGRHAHQQIIRSGCESSVNVQNSLIDMYAKCGSMEDAWRVFNKMASRDVVSWNIMILGHLKCGQRQKALQLFKQMQQEGMKPAPNTFVGVLNACASELALEEGRHAHEQIVQSGFESDVFVGSSLINMYTKCGSMEDPLQVFKKMPSHHVVSWNALIFGHVKYGQGRKSLELFQQMQLAGVELDPVTFVGVLNACASVVTLEEGRHAHEQIIQSGCESNVFVGSSLVNMYAKCGSLEDAQRVFNRMPVRDVVCCNAMIYGHVKCGQGQKALEVFQLMQQEGLEPDPATFIGVLNACTSVLALDEGRLTHEQVICSGYESDVSVSSSLVDMYAKCGSMEDAWRVFNMMPSHDVVSWTAMIQGHVKCGHGQKALELYQQMQREGVEPDLHTFVAALNACASVAALEEGRDIEERIIQCGCECNVFVASSLIDMYAKCGSMEDAWRVFNKRPSHDLVSFNAMILGLVQCAQGEKVLELFQEMQQEGVEPDAITFIGALNACASVAALDGGRHIEEQVILYGLKSNVFVGSSLVDMYAKSGSVDDAWRVFNKMPTHDVVPSNAMLGGFAMHAHGKEALAHFEWMCEEGVDINDATFVCLLSTCNHASLVYEGLSYFDSMGSVYSISTTVEHYACIVDLLGRSGHLQEALDLIQTMPFQPNAAVWMALLSSCRIHSDVGMGEHIAKQALEADPGNAAGYVLLSNIYAAAGKWDLRANIQKQRKERGMKKNLGRTWIEVNNKVHTFVVDDQDHPCMLEIHAELERLSKHMTHEGYVPETEIFLHDVEQEEDVLHLCHHSEKLAIAFGLISTPPGTPLRITKNLRVCGDCHTASKFISKIVGRAILMRDTNRFHHFEDGICSCRDSW
jgi:pentatricopeptide repeat protein